METNNYEELFYQLSSAVEEYLSEPYGSKHKQQAELELKKAFDKVSQDHKKLSGNSSSSIKKFFK